MRLHARRLFHKGHEPAVEQTTPKRADTARQERGGYGADTDAHRSTRTHKPVDQCDTYTAPVKEILRLTKFAVKHLGRRPSFDALDSTASHHSLVRIFSYRPNSTP